MGLPSSCAGREWDEPVTVNAIRVPQPLIYLDDIIFNYDSLIVRIDGPIDEEDLTKCAKDRRAANLCAELAMYHEENNHRDRDNMSESRVGFWRLQELKLIFGLPTRLRDRTEEDNLKAVGRTCCPRREWEAHLEAEFEALGIRFTDIVGLGPLTTCRRSCLRSFGGEAEYRHERKLAAAQVRKIDAGHIG